MSVPTHIIDPDGEVIIVLSNANAPFAQPDEHTDFAYPAEEPAAQFDNEPPPAEPPAAIPDEHLVQSKAEIESVSEAHDEGPFRIQVSAKHLMLASPYFKESLSGRWKESVGFLEKGSGEIPATNWDIEAFIILLRAIHGQHYHIPRKLTLEMLAKVAELTDYYQCRETVSIWEDIWVRGLEETMPETYCRDLFLWIWVSYFFNMRDSLREATSRAMSLGEGRMGNLGLIPDRVINAMIYIRCASIERVLDKLYHTQEALLSGSRGCDFECSSMMYGALTREMRSASLLSPRPAPPFDEISYKTLVKKILAFRSPSWTGWSSSAYLGYGNSPHSCSTSNFNKIFSGMNDAIEGLKVSVYNQ
ncbi:hypothetical protein ASPCAL09682 [Aspergillus calidoustus]|uniref:Uncharacterized protein n=1 Tax=Aspergillus calidoustus TaxID=454130 RepID=A0A0U5CB10_ASPCI|nr:hypothetical protein ASPCAL09682 [Aspergillus calidoustus]